MRRAIPMVDVFDNRIMSSQDEVLNEINIKFFEHFEYLNAICKVHDKLNSFELS